MRTTTPVAVTVAAAALVWVAPPGARAWQCAIGRPGDQVVITWPSEPGKTYALCRRGNVEGHWGLLTRRIATTKSLSVTVPIEGATAFFRSVEFPPNPVWVLDRFDRNDTEVPDIGLPEIGPEWVALDAHLNRPATASRIRNGRLEVDLPNFNTALAVGGQLPTIPEAMECEVVWTAASGTGAEGFVVLATSPSIEGGWARNCNHVRVLRDRVALDQFEDGRYAGMVGSSYIVPALPLDVPHRIRLAFAPDRSALFVWVNGRLQLECEHWRIPALRGRWFWYELHYRDADTQAALALESVAVDGPAELADK